MHGWKMRDWKMRDQQTKYKGPCSSLSCYSIRSKASTISFDVKPRPHVHICGDRSNRCYPVAGYCDLSIQYVGHPPSWISSTRVWTIHKLRVFGDVQRCRPTKFVGIDAVMSIIYKFYILRIQLKMSIYVPLSKRLYMLNKDNPCFIFIF